MTQKILVIDDDPTVRTYLTALLRDSGYEVFTAVDAEDGMVQAKKVKPDLITLDIQLPGEWGPRFFRKMSQHKGLNKTPVIVISGLPGHEYAVGKAVASISKPFDKDRLLSLIRETLA